MFFINEEQTMTNFSNASVRRMANKIMNLSEGKVQEILSELEPEFKKQVVINVIQKRIEKGRKNA
jgi:BMFP domain-containing protein YqiC